MSDRAPEPAPRAGADAYRPQEIEPRWQAAWEAEGLYRVDLEDASRPKHYFLTMFQIGRAHV